MVTTIVNSDNNSSNDSFGAQIHKYGDNNSKYGNNDSSDGSFGGWSVKVLKDLVLGILHNNICQDAVITGVVVANGNNNNDNDAAPDDILHANDGLVTNSNDNNNNDAAPDNVLHV